MASFLEAPKTTDAVELLKFFRQKREGSIKEEPKRGIASKPEVESVDDEDSGIVQMLRDWWFDTEDKVQVAQEEVQQTIANTPMPQLPTADANVLLPEEIQALKDMEAPFAKSDSDALNDALSSVSGDTPKAIEESAPTTVETLATPKGTGLMAKPDAYEVQPSESKVSTQEIISELPEDIKESVEQAEPKTNEEVNAALFDATSFSGEISTPSKGEDILTWIAQNTYGLREDDPAFKKAFKSVTNIDPQKTPWCGAFAGHVLKNIGVSLPNDAKINPALAFNYRNVGEEVYNHNPTTNKTYAGSLDAVKPGDLIVFNKADRRKDGSFAWAKGHVTFVVGVEEDGSILAVGGNQGGVAAGGGAIQTSRYSPDVIRKNYKGGFTVRRITNDSLEQTDPAIIAALTKDIAEGGAGL